MCRFPKIVVIGVGYIGSRVLTQLVDCGCSPLLRVFTRDDKQAILGIKCSKHIPELCRGNTIDILILCTPTREYPSIFRHTSEFVTKETCVITSAFGLRRSKIFNSLKTPCVFRTYVEPNEISAGVAVTIDDSIDSSNQQRSNATSALQTSEDADEEFLQTVELAGRYILERNKNIKHFIYILENYYFVLGMAKGLARHEAIKSILGTGSGSTRSTSNHDEYSGESSIIDAAIRDGWSFNIITKLQSQIGMPFQLYFSKMVKVVDLPPLSTLAAVSLGAATVGTSAVTKANYATSGKLVSTQHQASGLYGSHSSSVELLEDENEDDEDDDSDDDGLEKKDVVAAADSTAAPGDLTDSCMRSDEEIMEIFRLDNNYDENWVDYTNLANLVVEAGAS